MKSGFLWICAPEPLNPPSPISCQASCLRSQQSPAAPGSPTSWQGWWQHAAGLGKGPAATSVLPLDAQLHCK